MKIVLITHSTGIKGPGDFLEDYLFKKKHDVTKIEHPLDTYEGKKTYVYKNGKLVYQFNREKISLFNYIVDFYLSLKFLFLNKANAVIGANNFDTFAAIVARKMFAQKIEKIIYFASDYSEERFKNKFLDFLYRILETFVIKHSDCVISNTKRAAKRREEHGLPKEKSIIIPNGILLKNPNFSPKTIDKTSFIYIGNVTKEHGILELITVLFPYINKLVVIGQGDQWKILRELTVRKNISTQYYFQKDHDFVIQSLQKFNGFGLAPYNLFSKWTYYSSPIKIVEYASCGVPVITTDVTELSEKIVQDKLGIVIKNLDAKDIKKQIYEFDTTEFYKKAKKFYEEYNSDKLYRQIPI